MRGASRKPTLRASSALGSTRATRISARRPGLPVDASARRPGAHEPAVLAAQRHEVGDRRERDEVEVVVGASPGSLRRRRARAPARACRRRRRRTGPDTGSRRAPGGRSARRAARRRRAAVVVGDDDVEPARPRERHLLDGGDRAVDRHQQPRAARGEPLDRRRRQAVAVVHAARQEPVDVGARARRSARSSIAVAHTPSTS